MKFAHQPFFCSIGTSENSPAFQCRGALLNHCNVSDSDKFHMPTGLIVNQRLSIFGEKAMFRFFNANDIAVVEPQRIRLKWPTVFNVQKNLYRHASIVRDRRRSVKSGQIKLQFLKNKNLIQN